MACQICNSNNLKKIEIKEERLLIGEKFTYDICNNCKLVQLRTKPKNMEKYYSNYSYHNNKQSTKNKQHKFDQIYNKISSILLKPMSQFEPKTKDKKIMILDIGCAKGAYLKKLKDKGFERLYGIEISQEAVSNKIDKDLNISCTSIEEYTPLKKFDLITMHQVFEHIEYSKPALKKIKKMLTQNGEIVMSFPNYNSFARKLFGKHWPGYDAPRHYFTYSPTNLKILANQCDMKISKIKYISRPSQFTGSFQYRWNEKHSKETLENGFFRNSKMLDFLFLLPSYFLNLIRFGDMIEVHLKHSK